MNRNTLIVLFIFLFVFLGTVIGIVSKESVKDYDNMFIKEIQITPQGFVILSCEESGERKDDYVIILKHEQIVGKIYKGNIKYKIKFNQYYFENNN